MSKLAQIYPAFQEAVLTGNSAGVAPMLSSHGGLTPEQQLAIYREGYRIRLLGVLKDTFEGTVFYLGEAAFEKMAMRYIEAVSPTSYMIDHYPFGLVSWIESEGLILDECSHNLLMFESAIERSYLSDYNYNLFGCSFNEDVNFDPKSILKLNASVRLLALEYDVHAWLESFRMGEASQIPVRQKNYLLVVRDKTLVKCLALVPAAYELLSRLRDGMPIEAAIDAVCVMDVSYPRILEDHAQEWFAQWVKLGVFVLKH